MISNILMLTEINLIESKCCESLLDWHLTFLKLSDENKSLLDQSLTRIVKLSFFVISYIWIP